MNIKTKELVEVALICSLVIILSIFSKQLIFILEYFSFVLCLPFVYIGYKYKFSVSILSIVSAFLLSFFISGIIPSILILIRSIIGVCYGYSLSKKSVSQAIILTLLIELASYFITSILFAEFFGYDIGEEFLIIQKFLNVSDINLSSNIKQIIFMIIIILLVLTSILETYIIHISSRMLLSRLRLLEYKPKSIYYYEQNKLHNNILLTTLLISLIFFKFKVLQSISLFVFVFSSLYFMFYGFVLLTLILRKTLKINFIYIYILSLVLAFLLNIFLVILGIVYLYSDIKYKILERIT